MNVRRVLPVILLMFVASGCAALIYEVVWFQLLQLVIGSSAISLAVLLGTFMGGLCAGSLLTPRYLDARHHPLRVYAFIEFGIGVIALLVLFGLPLVNLIYTSWAGSGVAGVLFRAVVAGICLLPPTFLMGATLPVLSRSVETSPEGVSWLGYFYAGNTLGAVLGSVVAGFYLLRVFDVSTATYVGVGLNLAVGAVALALVRRVPNRAADHAPAVPPRLSADARAVYITIGLSGFTALGAEVVWTRMLSLLFGGSTYTFSLILAAFLAGIALGSGLGSAVARSVRQPRVALAWTQGLLVLATAWAALMLTDSLPYWPIDPSIAHTPWFNFQLDFARCLWTVLPATLLWGATFPLALASVAGGGQDPARLVGGLYGANTIGAIAGSLVTGLVLVPWIGSQHTTQVMVIASAVAALLVLMPTVGVPDERRARLRFGVGAVVLGASAALVIVFAIRPVSGLLVAYGRYSAVRQNGADIFYVGEGMSSSVAVSRLADGTLNYHNAGKVQASSEAQDMRLQRMLGHLTTLIPKHPKSVMVIGCGAGVTAGAVAVDPAVEQVTIVEIEPLVPRTVSTHFAKHNFDVVRQPKVRVQIDDARHFTLTSREKFDAVTSDPLDPWVKGAAMLYTKEFFESVRAHLNPGGVVTLFVQLYWSNPEAVKSELASFFDVFPNGIVMGNTYNGGGYDLVLVGQVEKPQIDIAAIDARLHRPEYQTLALSLSQIGLGSAMELMANYAGSARDLKPYLADAEINRDRNLRLQYLAGMGLNLQESGQIYSAMLAFRTPPEVFVGSDDMKTRLWEMIQGAPGR
jgi:spermidine synthase